MSHRVSRPPLFVDLDGTIISSDVTWESLVDAAGRRPDVLLRAPVWVLRGKPYLKNRLAEISAPDPAHLPYREEVLEWLKQQNEGGRRLVLASASHRSVVESVSEHLGLFEAAIGTEGPPNFSGEGKVEAIRDYLGAEDAAFDYAGDSAADLAVWKHAQKGVAVYPKASILRRAERICEIEKVWTSPSRQASALIRQFEPARWLWTLSALLLPMLFGWSVLLEHLPALGLMIAGLVAVESSAATGASLFFVETDRSGASQRYNAFAAGDLGIARGLQWMAALFVSGFLLMLAATSFAFALVAIIGLFGLLLTSRRYRPRSPTGFSARFGAHAFRLLSGAVVCGLAGFRIFIVVVVVAGVLAGVAPVAKERRAPAAGPDATHSRPWIRGNDP